MKAARPASSVSMGAQSPTRNCLGPVEKIKKAQKAPLQSLGHRLRRLHMFSHSALRQRRQPAQASAMASLACQTLFIALIVKICQNRAGFAMTLQEVVSMLASAHDVSQTNFKPCTTAASEELEPADLPIYISTQEQSLSKHHPAPSSSGTFAWCRFLD